MKYDDASSLISTNTTRWFKYLKLNTWIGLESKKRMHLKYFKNQVLFGVYIYIYIYIYNLNFMHHSHIKSLIDFFHLKHPNKKFIFLVTHTELHTCPCVVTTITCKKWLCDMACLRHFLYECYILDVYHRYEEKNILYRSKVINAPHYIWRTPKNNTTKWIFQLSL